MDSVRWCGGAVARSLSPLSHSHQSITTQVIFCRCGASADCAATSPPEGSRAAPSAASLSWTAELCTGCAAAACFAASRCCMFLRMVCRRQACDQSPVRSVNMKYTRKYWQVSIFEDARWWAGAAAAAQQRLCQVWEFESAASLTGRCSGCCATVGYLLAVTASRIILASNL